MTTASTQPAKITDGVLCIAFAITQMSLRNWRNGTKKRSPLPFKEDKEGKRTYNEAAVCKWADKNGVSFAVGLQDAAAKAQALQAKKGPKPSQPIAAKNKERLSPVKAVQEAKPVVKKTSKPASTPKKKVAAKKTASSEASAVQASV